MKYLLLSLLGSRVIFLCNYGGSRSRLAPTHPEWQFAVLCHTLATMGPWTDDRFLSFQSL